MAGSSANKESNQRGSQNRNSRRRRREQVDRSDSDTSDDNSPNRHQEPILPRDPLFLLQEQLRELREDDRATQQEYDEVSKQAMESSKVLNEMWENIMLPETDDDSNDDIPNGSIFGDSEVSSGPSDLSCLTDSSSSEDGDIPNDGDHLKHSTKDKSKGQRKCTGGRSSETFPQFQGRINQRYAPVPDVPQEELSEGLICIAKWMNQWVRVQLQAYDTDSETCDVSALDYGKYFTVHRSDIKPIRIDMIPENSIAYQAAEIKITTGTDTVPEDKPWKVIKESQCKRLTDATNVDGSNFEVIEIKPTNGEYGIDSTAISIDPVPSTSDTQISVPMQVENQQQTKTYRHSIGYLQYQWAKQQPEFLELRDNLANKHQFPTSNDANIFAFIEFMEFHQKQDEDHSNVELTRLKLRAVKKKKEVKKLYRCKFRDRIRMEEKRYKKKESIIKRKHERSTRNKYLKGVPDTSFTMDEWQMMQQENMKELTREKNMLPKSEV